MSIHFNLTLILTIIGLAMFTPRSIHFNQHVLALVHDKIHKTVSNDLQYGPSRFHDWSGDWKRPTIRVRVRVSVRVRVRS